MIYKEKSMPSKNKDIFMVAGSKGGVGKSLVTIGLIDTLLQKNEKVMLIESDTSNPDTAKMMKGEVEIKLVDLDNADGWIEVVNLCDEFANHNIVVNTAARNNKGIAAYSSTLRLTLDELKRNIKTLWVINRHRDSLELLKEYLEYFNKYKIYVLRNCYFGDEQKFELYNTSNIKKSIEENKGHSYNFPELADRVCDGLYSNRLSITKALRDFPIGNRAELNRWRNEVSKVLTEIIDD